MTEASARHVPVMAAPAITWLAIRGGGTYIDATFGGGGYTRAMLATPGASVVAIDRDDSAIAQGAALAAQFPGRLALVTGRYADLDTFARRAGHGTVDGVVFDLGVSSMQLDEAGRGFSFRFDGPLDMRMGGDGPSAADIVAHASVRDLSTIIAVLGEERRASAVARAIVRARELAAVETTRALAEIVASVVHARDAAIHPATRTFQALRLFVNDELNELAQGLLAAERVLKPGGRLVVVSFHSLEDRIVKNFINDRSRPPARSRHLPEADFAAPTLRPLTRRPQTPDTAEIAANPRARSAKLRAAERTDAAPTMMTVSGLPRLPSVAEVMRGRG